jgi:hypothetical protein
MSIFSKFKQPDYELFIENFKPQLATKEELKLITTYRTPSLCYIKSSARNVSFNDVQIDTLHYIIVTCYMCTPEQKYQATMVVIYKLYLDQKDLALVQEAKDELIPFLNGVKPIEEDFSFLNDITSKYNDKFFYLIQIQIGVNDILKYGITNRQPRVRFAQIKTDIKYKYGNQGISIKPLLIIHCDDNKVFEDEVQSLLSENNINTTGYSFKGSSETIPSKCRQIVTDEIIVPLVAKFSAKLLYEDNS